MNTRRQVVLRIEESLDVAPAESWTLDECMTILAALNKIAKGRQQVPPGAHTNVVPFKAVPR